MSVDITPEVVIAAYEKTGLVPVMRGYGDGVRCGCALTAVLKMYNPDKPICSTSFSEHFGIGITWMDGFITGFDQIAEPFSPGSSTRTYHDGYDRGKEVYDAVKAYAVAKGLSILEEEEFYDSLKNVEN